MPTDSVMRRVALKELRQWFASSFAWLLLAAFVGACLFIFFWLESFFARNIADVGPLFFWMPLLLLPFCAVLSMRLWSDERRLGTLESLATQPVSLWQLVLGKYRACMTLLLIALIGTLPLPTTVALIAGLEWGPVLTGYLACLLLGSVYIAIGLCMSALSNNAIISLIGCVSVCVLLYVLGRPVLTDLLPYREAEILRLLGIEPRFGSIARGVLDVRDIVYFTSLTLFFLALNHYFLERSGWAADTTTRRQRAERSKTALVLANLLLINLWVSQSTDWRIDTTEGRQFSMSQTTRNVLAEIQEPLVIRGFFSDRSHPLLAPLIPQLKSLLDEYRRNGGGNVDLEFVDPTGNTQLENELSQAFGIRTLPFQIMDRHQTSVVNAYFNILVQYGDAFEVLGFSDLIEVHNTAGKPDRVRLRKPEYDLTRAIHDVLARYRSGGNLFDAIEEPVEFIGYASSPELLPEPLQDYQQNIQPQLELAAKHSNGKFSFRFLEPELRDGLLAKQLREKWGFKPMSLSEDDEHTFWFYMILADTQQVVPLPVGDFDPANFRMLLDSSLKRFTRGFRKSIALALPAITDEGPTFTNLENALARKYRVLSEDLTDGNVNPEADILAVVAPRQLSTLSVRAIDQFLMRGGTILLITSPFSATVNAQGLELLNWSSGLEPWLAHHGISLGDSLVVDPQHARFPAPVVRGTGDRTVREMQIIDYPYFIDLRPPGLSRTHPITRDLQQVTMAWASPIDALSGPLRRLSTLLESSPRSWRDTRPRIAPTWVPGLAQAQLDATPPKGVTRDSNTVGLIVEGQFQSFFSALVDETGNEGLIRQSPEAARIILFSANDLVADRVLQSLVSVTGTQYLGAVELVNNALDWALDEGEFLDIPAYGLFSRSLPMLPREQQIRLEYLNYGLALLWLLLVAGSAAVARAWRRRSYRKRLAL